MRFNQTARRAGLLALLLVAGIAPAYATQTPPGTTISNTATASYTDSNGNAITATSNTVTTIVQNAPVITNTNGGNQNVPLNSTATDTFTLTNTGNSSGDIQVTANTVTGTNVGSITLYTLTLPAGATLISGGASAAGTTTYGTLGALNTYLATVNVPSGSAATVAVAYSTGTASAGTTIVDSLTATVTYAAVGSAAAATSTAATSATTDTVTNDARLDIQKTAVQPTTAGGAIAYTIKANNGGAFTAHYVQALTQVTGLAKPGILISDKIPLFNGVPLALTGTPAVSTSTTYGYANDSNQTAVIVCSTQNPATSWSTSCPTDGSVKYIAVFISSGTLTNTPTGGDGLLPDAANSTAATVSGPTVTNAAVTLTFSIVQPAGNGSGVAGSVTNVADGVFTNNATTPQIVCPSGPYTDANTAGAATNAETCLQNLTPDTTGSPNAASGQTANQAVSAWGVSVGPSGFPLALGAATGLGTADSNHDFTDYAFTDPLSPPTTTSTAPTAITGNATAHAVSFCVPNTVENTGNLTDGNISLAVAAPTLPSAWTVQLYSDSTCSTSPLSVSSTTNATTTATLSLASGSTQTFYVKYTSPSGTSAFTPYASIVTASTSSGTSTPSNTTYNELYNGFIALTKVATVTSSGCPVGATVTSVCAGGTIQYQIYIENVAMASSGTGATEPASALLTNSTGGIVVGDDGTAGTNWFAQIGSTGTYVTSGLNAVPALTIGGTANSSSACTYYYGNPVGSGSSTFTAPNYTVGSLANGPSKFSCVLGGAAGSATQLPAGSTSSATWMVLTFTVTVRAN
jgi:hypothetical protein